LAYDFIEIYKFPSSENKLRTIRKASNTAIKSGDISL